ncbi:MAG: hypothetical protein M3P11_04765 [Actinomycetota bacterium]|nr:hypothetical protein [Actinomycetota bacterium]
MRKLLIATGVVVMLVTAAGPAFAATNPNGSGQPVAIDCTDPGATGSPGLSSSAPGSAFNEDPGGVAGAVYAGNGANTTTPANAAAVSQYDIACYQVTQNH